MKSIKRFGLAAALSSVSTLALAQATEVNLVFIVDESGSMGPEQQFIGQVAPDIVTELGNAGVNTVNFGLVGYGSGGVDQSGGTEPVGGGLYGNAADFATATQGLSLSGGFEDGYEGIDFALQNYLNGTPTTFILLTDEDRDIGTPALTFGSIEQELANNNISLVVVVNANFEDTNGQSAIATNGSLAFVPDGAGGATAEPYDPATGIVSASGTTEADYINLALGTPSGCAVDLNFLRAGGIDAQAFTDVFTTLCVLTAATSSGGPTTLPLNQFRDIARVIAANHRGIVKQVIIVRGDSPAGQHFSSKMSDSGTKVTENAFGMEEMRLFGAFTGVTGEYDDTGNNVGIDYHGGGLLFGGDYTTETESGGTMRYALSLSYDEVQGDLEGSDSTSDSKGITIGGTASYFDPQGWYVLGDLQFGFHDFSNKREVGSSFASSDPKVRSITTEVEAGYTYALEGPLQTITPFAGLGFGRYEVSDYEEDTGIEIDDFTTDVGYAIVGVRGNSTIPSDMGDYYAAFEVAGRINLFSDDETAEFVSGTGTAIVDGVEDDSLAVTLEVGYDVDEKSRLFARYSGNYSEVVQQHSLNLGYQYNF